MGHAPPRAKPRPTQLQAVHHAYVEGRIDVYELEQRVDELLRSGTADKPVPLLPPPNPADAYRALPLSRLSG